MSINGIGMNGDEHMIKKICLVFISVSIITGLILAFVYREKKYDSMDNSICYSAVVTGIDDAEITALDNDYEIMLDESDIIVAVTALSNRTKKDNTVLTEVSIKKIYKGTLAEDTIYIYEPVEIIKVDKEYNIYFTTSAYVLMEPNNDYLLFLKIDHKPQEYKLSPLEESSYLLTNETLGKYPINRCTKYSEIEESVVFSQVESLALLSNNQELIDVYERCYKRAMREFN